MANPMDSKGFTLIELLVVVAIIGILAAVGVVAFNGFIDNSRASATRSNHEHVVRFIRSSIMKCHTGGELNLNSSGAVLSDDLCNLVTNADANALNSNFKAHFTFHGFCNTYGLLHSSGTCQEGVNLGGVIGQGGILGEIRLFSDEANDTIIVDTHFDDDDEGEGLYLNDAISIN
tara:strand:+ start:87 stop:611 length:525 start_codon:yes stop_codon:yes gene_type:complete